MFDRGRIVETGTFDELVRRGGAFAALAKAQFLVAESAEAAPASDDTVAAEPAEPRTVVVPPPNEITKDAAEEPAT